MSSSGWDESAEAWIAAQGEHGDFTRRFVCDPAMLARIEGRGFRRALDIGCGEGRFCRILNGLGIAATGVDPTAALIGEARRRDPGGDYRIGNAEALALPDGAFDLVVSYLALIDIVDLAAAIGEMARMLTPGGTLLIANLTSFNTAGAEWGWIKDASGAKRHYPIDDYLTERSTSVGWKGIRIVNWHRPLSRYMTLLIEQGLRLTHFVEPYPTGGDAGEIVEYARAPYAFVMEWRKA